AGMGLFGWPFWLAALAAIGAMALLGLLIERAIIRPVLGQPQFSIVMLTFGLGYVMRGLVTMVPGIGTDTHALAVPYKGSTLNVGGAVTLGMEQLVVIAATAVLCAVLWLLFRFTRVGIAMQASSQNQ